MIFISEVKEFDGMLSSERSAKGLLKELLSIKKASQPSANGQVFSEKKWFVYANKVWDTIKKSPFISEYSRLMT